MEKTNTHRGKYATRIGPELWRYIDRVNGLFPHNADELPIQEQRALYDAMCRVFCAPRPSNVAVRDERIALPDRDIPIRLYHRNESKAATTVLFFHGGGFVLGGLDSHDDICAELCAATGFDVVSTDYRLAPEHVHPAAFDDALAAFVWLAKRRRPIVLCGESAGGNLAAAVAHETRRAASPAGGQVLICPVLGGDEASGSYVEHAEAPLLTTEEIALYRRLRTGKAWRPGDATVDPLHDSNFSGLPPTVIVTAEFDPATSDGQTYRDRILFAGGRAVWRQEQGLTHSFLRGRILVEAARRAFDRIVLDLQALGQ